MIVFPAGMGAPIIFVYLFVFFLMLMHELQSLIGRWRNFGALKARREKHEEKLLFFFILFLYFVWGTGFVAG